MIIYYKLVHYFLIENAQLHSTNSVVIFTFQRVDVSLYNADDMYVYSTISVGFGLQIVNERLA